MSGVAITRYLLSNNSNLIAQVPAARIMAGVLPLNTSLPAISVSQITSNQHLNVAMTGQKLCTEHVQVTVEAPTYPLQKSILALIRAALPNTHGTVNGFECDSILPDMEGPDIFDADMQIYIQSQDFIIRFNR